MLQILFEKELKPNRLEYHYKISVGDFDFDKDPVLLAECYIETAASMEECTKAINNCLIAVQERIEDIKNESLDAEL